MSRSGFLLAEDEAIKQHLSNITVTDDRNANRPVKVFFRYPEGETEKHYPFITIEMASLNYARNRQHSEHSLYFADAEQHPNIVDDPNYLGYVPSELDEDGLLTELGVNGAAYLRMESPIPVDLVYQVSTYTRSALHDRQLTAHFLRYVFPMRSNYLVIPADGTVRRMDLLNWSQADLLDVEAGYRKRTFRKMYNVMINAEIMRTDLELIKQATSVVGNINVIEGDITVNTSSLSEEF